jgi:uncharacterized protein YbaR (Trm112 family)
VFFELTDVLTCPACGPAHGLVLLVREVEERRVRSGWLGCPNCRRDYPVVEGVADLRLEPGASRPARPRFEDDELAVKILALSGLAGERGPLLLGDRLEHVAAGVADLAPELEVIAVAKRPERLAARPGVSGVACDAVEFPVAEQKLRCVAIAPGGASQVVEAAARRVSAGGRLLLFDATAEDIAEVERSGFTVLAAEGATAVAERKGGSLPVIK